MARAVRMPAVLAVVVAAATGLVFLLL